MQNIRVENLRFLNAAGFTVAESLPLSRLEAGEEPRLRPEKEILGRLVALKTLWLWVDTHPLSETTETLLKMIDSGNVTHHLTQQENSILALTREDAVAEYEHVMGWKNENCWSLAWILGFPKAPMVEAGQLSGSEGKDLMLDWLPNSASELRELERKSQLRAASEVHDLEDLFYCAHNAVRSAQMGASTVPDGFHPIVDGGCIHERRHALTWSLSPGVAWEDTDLST